MAYFECINCSHKIHQNFVFAIFSPKCEKCKGPLEKKELIGIPNKKLWEEISALNWKYGRSKMLDRLDRAVGAYHTADRSTDRKELSALRNLLRALSNWCSAKVNEYGHERRHPDYPNDVEDELVPHWLVKDAWKQSKRVGPITDLLVVAARAVHNNALISDAQALWRVIPRSDPRIPLQAPYGFIVNAISDRGDNDPVYVKSLLKDPATISNGLVSASYITSGVNTVWASSGFILDVPERNIFAAGTQNLATKSHVGHMHMARKYVEMLDIFLEPRPRPCPVNPLLPPSELIAAMKIMPGVNKYMQMNEMVILGTAISPGAEFSRVRVVGIFVMEDDKQPSPERMQIYKQLNSVPHNLPIVKLHLAATSTVKAN